MALLRRLGHNLLLLEMDLDYITKLLKVSVPDTNARAGWVVDVDNLLTAMDRMDIKYPVRIRYMTSTGLYQKLHGAHYVKISDSITGAPYWHRITVDQTSPADDANETLWHELAHAMQSERWAEHTNRPINRFYREGYMPAKGYWGKSYEENKFEKHAREVAEHNQHLKLVH